MTTIESIAPGQVASRNRERTAGSGRRQTMRLVAVALGASLAGGAFGAAAAVAVPRLTWDHAAEQARWMEFSERFAEAVRVDDLWQQQHPEPR